MGDGSAHSTWKKGMVWGSNRQSLAAYQADERREELPAELPPATWPVADHVLDVLIKPFSSCGIETGGQRRSVCVCVC